MLSMQALEYSSSLAMIRGMKQLLREGLRPRDVLFVALDLAGHVHLAVPERLKEVERLRVGDKLSLPAPFVERCFHLDAVHPRAEGVVVVNGDRRIGSCHNMVDVASLVCWFVEATGDQSIFFGCTPHQPGSWWVQGERTVALHERGFVELVPAHQGLLARRVMDSGLYFLSAEAAAAGELEGWRRVYTSPLGNILMLERRLLYDQLVLSCRDGLVEVDVFDLPKVSETGRLPLAGGFAVVGRISGGAFAVARGEPLDWGFENLGPATLVGSGGCSFMELRTLLRARGASAALDG